jgi:hypothetical protein
LRHRLLKATFAFTEEPPAWCGRTSRGDKIAVRTAHESRPCESVSKENRSVCKAQTCSLGSSITLADREALVNVGVFLRAPPTPARRLRESRKFEPQTRRSALCSRTASRVRFDFGGYGRAVRVFARLCRSLRSDLAARCFGY